MNSTSPQLLLGLYIAAILAAAGLFLLIGIARRAVTNHLAQSPSISESRGKELEAQSIPAPSRDAVVRRAPTLYRGYILNDQGEAHHPVILEGIYDAAQFCSRYASISPGLFVMEGEDIVFEAQGGKEKYNGLPMAIAFAPPAGMARSGSVSPFLRFYKEALEIKPTNPGDIPSWRSYTRFRQADLLCVAARLGVNLFTERDYQPDRAAAK